MRGDPGIPDERKWVRRDELEWDRYWDLMVEGRGNGARSGNDIFCAIDRDLESDISQALRDMRAYCV